MFHYRRKATLPAESVTVYAGTYENCIVVEGTNTIQPREGGEPYRSWQRVTYAPGVGVIRVEADSPTLERELVEYHPAG